MTSCQTALRDVTVDSLKETNFWLRYQFEIIGDVRRNRNNDRSNNLSISLLFLFKYWLEWKQTEYNWSLENFIPDFWGLKESIPRSYISKISYSYVNPNWRENKRFIRKPPVISEDFYQNLRKTKLFNVIQYVIFLCDSRRHNF